ncbi:hypothetical protein SANTM175S_00845 [Streptomyces antimycoticus]
MAAAALMVFLFTFTSFGVIQILGGPRYATLEVAIYRETAQLLDLPAAAVLTLVQFAAVAAVLALHAWTVRRRESALRLVDPGRTARRPSGPAQWALLWGVLAVVVLLIVTPLAVLVERSLNGPDGYGFTYYEALKSAADSGGTFFVAPMEAVGNSLRYAAVATVFALAVGGLAAAALTRKAGRLVRGFDALLMLPLGHLGRHRGIRVSDRPRRAPAGPALLGPGAARPGPGGRALRRTDHAPVLRAVDHRLREAAPACSERPVAGLAGSGPAVGGTGRGGRGGLRVRRVPGRVRGDRLHRAPRPADPPGGHRPVLWAGPDSSPTGRRWP